MLSSIIVTDPGGMGGTPCFRGTRVPLKNLLDYLEGDIRSRSFWRISLL